MDEWLFVHRESLKDEQVLGKLCVKNLEHLYYFESSATTFSNNEKLSSVLLHRRDNHRIESKIY